jgi:hypothetical protein
MGFAHSNLVFLDVGCCMPPRLLDDSLSEIREVERYSSNLHHEAQQGETARAHRRNERKYGPADALQIGVSGMAPAEVVAGAKEYHR